eukprot:Awhi_evm1s11265
MKDGDFEGSGDLALQLKEVNILVEREKNDNFHLRSSVETLEREISLLRTQKENTE